MSIVNRVHTLTRRVFGASITTGRKEVPASFTKTKRNAVHRNKLARLMKKARHTVTKNGHGLKQTSMYRNIIKR